MRILLTGSSGFIGQAVLNHFLQAGHDVLRVVRRGQVSADEIGWSPQTGRLTPLPRDVDAVIHLAGETLLGRWTAAKIKAIRESRVEPTRLLAQELSRLPQPPRHFLCASATGFYGSRADEILTEASPPGSGFLAETCIQWEAACQPAISAGIRVANFRMGMVLGAGGGALKAMLTPYKLGLGGMLGSGNQYWSWISLEDTARAIGYILDHDSLSGPVNVVSPSPCTNREFTHALGGVLHRPTVLRVPTAMLELATGQLADEMPLASVRVMPRRLLESGFAFNDSNIVECLQSLLGQPVASGV